MFKLKKTEAASVSIQRKKDALALRFCEDPAFSWVLEKFVRLIISQASILKKSLTRSNLALAQMGVTNIRTLKRILLIIVKKQCLDILKGGIWCFFVESIEA